MTKEEFEEVFRAGWKAGVLQATRATMGERLEFAISDEIIAKGQDERSQFQSSAWWHRYVEYYWEGK